MLAQNMVVILLSHPSGNFPSSSQEGDGKCLTYFPLTISSNCFVLEREIGEISERGYVAFGYFGWLTVSKPIKAMSLTPKASLELDLLILHFKSAVAP